MDNKKILKAIRDIEDVRIELHSIAKLVQIKGNLIASEHFIITLSGILGRSSCVLLNEMTGE